MADEQHGEKHEQIYCSQDYRFHHHYRLPLCQDLGYRSIRRALLGYVAQSVSKARRPGGYHFLGMIVPPKGIAAKDGVVKAEVFPEK